jgi:hypothetical protein
MSGSTAGQRIARRILQAGGPRLLGLVQFGFGALVLGVNFAFIVWDHSYSGTMFILGIPLLAMGMWTLLTGRTQAVQVTGPKPPLWWLVGFYTLLVVSLLFGIYLAIHLRKPGALDFLLQP